MAKIKRWNVSRYRKGELTAFLDQITNVIDRLPRTERGEEGASARLDTAIQRYLAAARQFEAAGGKRGKNEGVAEAFVHDKERDKLWRGSNAFLKAMTRHPDEAAAAAAVRVRRLYKAYKDPTSLSQNESNGIYANLLEDIAALDDETKEKSGIMPWYERMAAAQDAFMAAIKHREDIKNKQQTGVSPQARQEAEAAIRDLFQTINTHATILGDNYYNSFILHINNLMKDMKEVLERRKTLNRKKRGEKEGGKTDKNN